MHAQAARVSFPMLSSLTLNLFVTGYQLPGQGFAQGHGVRSAQIANRAMHELIDPVGPCVLKEDKQAIAE